jgi:hypothetical protein
MKLAVVRESRRGGLYLSPSNFGEKIEFIARECGEYQAGELVITLAAVHDTKPDEPRKGVRFIRVKSPDAKELEDISSEAFASRKEFTTQEIGEDFIVVKEELFLMLFLIAFGRSVSLTEHVQLQLRNFNLKFSDLRLDVVRWGGINEMPKISLNTVDTVLSPETDIKVPAWLTRELLEKAFSYDVTLEQEKERQRREEAKAAEEKEAAAQKIAREMEEQRLINLFLSVYPESIEWCPSPSTWPMFETEAINRELATYLGEKRVGHYSSFSHEIEWYERCWKLELKDEEVIITRTYSVEN